MSRFGALVRLSFRSLVNTIKFSSRKDKTKAASGVGGIVFMAGLSLYMSVIYSMLFASSLAGLGRIGLLMVVMPIVASLMSVMLTAFAAGGIVFGGKDNDLLLALPVSSFEVMLSKILALYLENLIITGFIVVPAGIVYMIYSGAFSIGFIFLLIISTLLLTLLNTTVALLLGFVTTWISGYLRDVKVLSNVLYIAYFVVIMVLAFRINTYAQNFIASVDSIQTAFGSWMYPFALFADGCFGGFGSLGMFTLISAAPFLLMTWAFSRNYKSIVTRLSSHSARSDYKLGRVQSSSQFFALFKKELGRFFGSPIYMLNTGCGMIILAIAAVAALIRKDALAEFFAEAQLSMPLFEVAVFLSLMLVGMSCTTAVSISLEGKTLWILKEAPVATGSIFDAKAACSMAVSIPISLVTSILFAFALSLSAAQCLLLFLACAAMATFMALLGLVINLRFPKLDADNDTVVVKQSLSAMLGLFGGMVLTGVLALVYALVLAPLVSFTIFLAAVIILMFVSSLLMRGWLTSKGARRLLEL